MDWGLGIVTGNLVGVPTKEVKALYWAYFVAKRLPMLSGVDDLVFMVIREVAGMDIWSRRDGNRAVSSGRGL